MDLYSLIAIIVAIVVIYIFIKFIVSPVIKLIVGIIIFLLIIYILQHFFNFNLSDVLGPFANYLDVGKWKGINWILTPLNHYLNQMFIFWRSMWNDISSGPKLK